MISSGVHCSRLAAMVLVSMISTTLLLTLTGCDPVEKSDPSGEPQTSAEPATAKFTVIDDEKLAATIERQLRARSDMEITMESVSADEFRKRTVEELDSDVIVYPIEMLNWMIENRMVSSIPKMFEDDENFAAADVLTIQRQLVPRIGRVKYAASLGSPSLNLLYRRDVFDQLEIAPPQTWREYQDAASKIAEAIDDGSVKSLESPLCEPLKDDWAAQVLIARTACYVRRYGTYSALFDIDSMEPLIARPPFVRALEELVEAAKTSKIDQANIDPAAAEQMLLDGRTAMAITWPTSGARRDKSIEADAQQQNSIASIPGAAEVFDFHSSKWRDRPDGGVVSVPVIATAGRLASVGRTSRQISFAMELIGLLSGREMGETICVESNSTAPFRTSQLATVTRWLSSEYSADSSEAYAEMIRMQNNRNLTMQTIRIPRGEEYLAALNDAVRKAIDGEPADKVLEQAADRWREITADAGLFEQKTSYRDSLGVNF